MVDSPPDFAALVAAAYPQDGAGPQEVMDRLWVALFSLPNWLFLMTPHSAESLQPTLQSIDGKAWMLVFTDGELLRNYAALNQNLDAKGNALFLSMDPAKAMTYLAQYTGAELFGVRFNERIERGWFSPLANLAPIPAFLKKNGLLKYQVSLKGRSAP